MALVLLENGLGLDLDSVDAARAAYDARAGTAAKAGPVPGKA